MHPPQELQVGCLPRICAHGTLPGLTRLARAACLACRNRFHSYLCIDPEPDQQPGARDQEEFIQVGRGPEPPAPDLAQLASRGGHGCSPATRAVPARTFPSSKGTMIV